MADPKLAEDDETVPLLLNAAPEKKKLLLLIVAPEKTEKNGPLNRPLTLTLPEAISNPEDTSPPLVDNEAVPVPGCIRKASVPLTRPAMVAALPVNVKRESPTSNVPRLATLRFE